MNVLAMPTNRHPQFTSSETISIKKLVASASDIVAPVWPLKTFIAVNPLQGLENLPFEEAVLKIERQRAASNDGTKGANWSTGN